MPQSSGAPKLPIVFAQVHVDRQPGVSLFERHSNETTRMIRKNEDEQQREVEAREHRRVPGRERGERRTAGDDEPDLVPVPDRSDRPQRRAPLLVLSRDEREQHPDPEVEPLEQEVHGPDDGDEAEPEGLEIHQ